MTVFTVSSVIAQTYPNKPIRIIVPFAPGGDSDIIARIIAEKLTESLGQQVLVENKPGADGRIATEMVAKAVPDGYTLLLGTVGILAVSPPLYKKVRYDPIKDFEPITELIFSPFVLLVNTSVPVRSVKELIALAKSKPGQLNYGSGATIFYLSTEIFKLMTGANIAHIPYKGVAPSMTALISGEVSMMFTAAIMGFSQVKAGNARALAICTNKRSPTIPDVPTMEESGFPFEAGAWFGVLAPAGTPKEIVKRLNTEIVRILRNPATIDYLSKIGDIVASTPEQFAAHIKTELEKYAEVIKDAGIPRID
jgi:tripartite-type tricarboxylate transporter receptor subunit TctC